MQNSSERPQPSHEQAVVVESTSQLHEEYPSELIPYAETRREIAGMQAQFDQDNLALRTGRENAESYAAQLGEFIAQLDSHRNEVINTERNITALRAEFATIVRRFGDLEATIDDAVQEHLATTMELKRFRKRNARIDEELIVLRRHRVSLEVKIGREEQKREDTATQLQGASPSDLDERNKLYSQIENSNAEISYQQNELGRCTEIIRGHQLKWDSNEATIQSLEAKEAGMTDVVKELLAEKEACVRIYQDLSVRIGETDRHRESLYPRLNEIQYTGPTGEPRAIAQEPMRMQEVESSAIEVEFAEVDGSTQASTGEYVSDKEWRISGAPQPRQEQPIDPTAVDIMDHFLGKEYPMNADSAGGERR